MKTQFVINEKGEKIAVIVSIKQYERMIEDLEDIKDFDRVKARMEKSIPFGSYLLKSKIKKTTHI